MTNEYLTEEQIKQMVTDAEAKENVDNATTSMFESGKPENIVAFQLELDNVLQKVEHNLRGDRLERVNGVPRWIKQTDERLILLNDYGVQLIMRLISTYVSRNTILSDFKKEEINEIVFCFARELNDLIYMKYEQIGLNTAEKRKEYPMLVLQMTDLVRSAYNRSINAGERTSMRSMINISQSQPLPPQISGDSGGRMGLFNPKKWFGAGGRES